jgi:hypothetical protein
MIHIVLLLKKMLKFPFFFVFFIKGVFYFPLSAMLITSDAQRSSVWRSVAKASAERPDFAERERVLERLTPER